MFHQAPLAFGHDIAVQRGAVLRLYLDVFALKGDREGERLRLSAPFLLERSGSRRRPGALVSGSENVGDGKLLSGPDSKDRTVG